MKSLGERTREYQSKAQRIHFLKLQAIHATDPQERKRHLMRLGIYLGKDLAQEIEKNDMACMAAAFSVLKEAGWRFDQDELISFLVKQDIDRGGISWGTEQDLLDE